MNLEQLEFYLDRGNSFGVNINTGDKTFLKWLMLAKRKPANRFFEIVREEDSPDLFAQEMFIKENPYHVRIAEIRREIFDTGEDHTNEDYRENASFYFKNLDDVSNFLQERHLNIEDLKWSSEVEFV